MSVTGKDEIARDIEHQAPRDANVWYPEIPDPCLSFISVPELPQAYRHRQEEMPLSMILFGGLKGELLPHIIKMTVWIADTHPVNCVVWGIGFTFDCLVEGKSSLVLGYSRDDGEYDFHIDGQGGERICQIDKISQYSLACDLGFRVRVNLRLGACSSSYAFGDGFANLLQKIHTTRHRTFEFPPTSSRVRLREDPITKSLSVPDGTIVGFCSRMVS